MSDISIANNAPIVPLPPKNNEKTPDLVGHLKKDRLDARELARTADPLTSKMAAKRVRDFAGSHFDIIHATLVAWGPMTVDQIAERCPLRSQQVNKRLDQMRKKGLAATTGKLGLSDAGNPCRIWRAL
jgi:hypothetical protein